MRVKLKTRARALKQETNAVFLAAKDPRTPWYAKGLVLLVVAYALSPIDLIPDFIPILGYLDDLIIVPGGIWLAIRMIPPEVLMEARQTALSDRAEEIGKVGSLIIVVLWVITAGVVIYLLLKLTKRI